MKFVPVSVTRKASMATLLAKKNSPQVLFAAGVVGFGATVVLACRATLKVSDVLDETNKELVDIEATVAEADQTKAKARVFVNSGFQMARLYGPTIIVGSLSVAALAGSNRILTKRNAALSAAYAGLDKSFRQYRDRVREELGEEKELDLYTGAREETIKIEGDNGPKKTKVKKRGSDSVSPYAVMFDETNKNWKTVPDHNRVFLEAQQRYMNHRLHAYNYVLLNDVYETLGYPKTSAGAVVGWVVNHDHARDQYIDFGLGDWPSAEDYKNGTEHAIMLDFNVDGPVYDLIDQIGRD